jgi:hypothetical protein
VLTAALALAVRGLLAAQDPAPAIYPVDEGSGPIEVRGAAGRREQWMCTRLVDAATGAPLRGRISAYVEHEHPEPATWPPLRTGEGDADGWVRLRVDDLLEERGLWLVAEAEGYAPSAEMTAFPQVPWELERGVDIPLSVLDALGRPMEEARIGWLLGCGHTADVRQVVTDRAGRATLKNASGTEGELWITARHAAAQYQDCGAWRPGRGVRTLHCDPAPTVQGIVLGADGAPRAGVHVGVAEYHRGPWCLTDGAGRFTLAGLDSTSLCVADGITGEEHWFDLPPTGDEVRLVLPPAGEDLRELPRPEDENVRIEIEVPDDAPTSAVPLVAWCRATGFVERTELSAGEARAHARAPGRYELLLGGGSSDWREERAILAVGEEGTAELRVPMTPRRRVRFWLDATSPFATLLPSHGDLQLVTETWQRSIEQEVREGLLVAVPESGPWGVRLRLFERALHVSGEGVDARGELELTPIEPHRVRARFADARGHARQGKLRVARHPRGHLEFEGEAPWSSVGESLELVTWLGPGRWLVQVESAEPEWRGPREPFEIELPPAANAVVDLGTIEFGAAHERGFALRLPGGAPAANLRVQWNGERRELDAEGRLPEGTFAGPGDQVIVDLEDGETIPFEARLEGAGPWSMAWSEGELELDVRDASGAPIPSFAVHMDGAIHLGADGALVRRGLPTGTREILIAAQGYLPQRLELTLAPRAEASLRLAPR